MILPAINQKAPNLKIKTLNGKFDLFQTPAKTFSLIIFYRGYHCPVCKDYLETLSSLYADYLELGVDRIIAVSGDDKDKALLAKEEWDIPRLEIGYDLDDQTMRDWGLYISSSISDKEPRLFNEPGLFLVSSDGDLFYSAINSMPFGRPSLEKMRDAIKFIINDDYPARGNLRIQEKTKSLTDDEQRETQAGINRLFVNRWSPRAFDKNYKIEKKEFQKLFAAAKWAPSCFNEQPWRFLVASRNSKKFDDFLSLINEFNQSWAKNASAIVFIIGSKNFDKTGKENYTYQFDCGAAWMSLSHQANIMGLQTHGMGGIEREKIIDYFDLNADEEDVICGFAIGKNAEVGVLSSDLQEKEHLSPRKDLEEVFELY